MKPTLSIAVPCYNEEKNIPLVLDKFNKAFSDKEFRKKLELILVDNNSKDNTQEVLKKLLKKKEYDFARSVFQPKPGYGAAIYKGLEAAKGSYVGWTHADLQTDPKDVLTALKILHEMKYPKNIYVKGKRYGRPIADVLFNTLGMSVFESLVLGKGTYYDINAQPNIFPRSLFEKMKHPPEDFSFDLYTYYLSKVYNYNMKRFPVYFGKRIFGESAWNTGWKARFKFAKRTIDFTLKLKKQLKQGKL
jgi:glycosyltransferase involved in cell wall biosynthesis